MREPLRRPDVLLYWTAHEPHGGLGEGARLLGSVRGDGVERFGQVPDDPGFLVLYSLGHDELIAARALR